MDDKHGDVDTESRQLYQSVSQHVESTLTDVQTQDQSVSNLCKDHCAKLQQDLHKV